MKFMCNFEIDLKLIEEKFDIDFKKYFEWGLNNMREMEADNLEVSRLERTTLMIWENYLYGILL